MDYLKKSRIEEVLIAILGKGTVTSQLISRIEKILDAIRVKGSYDGITMSEVEGILICILLGKRFEKPTHSRIAAMLKVKANGGEYTELRKSRVEELIFEWINAVESATYTGTLPATLRTVEGYLESYKIYGNTEQNGTPTPENPIVPIGCGERTENVMPAGEQKTVVSNGVTFSSDGNGRYHIGGTATKAAFAQFNLLSAFTTPISVSNGGQGTLSLFNTSSDTNVSFVFYNGTTKVDDWRLYQTRRTSTVYNILSNKYVDSVIITVSSGVTVDMTITPEFTNDGIIPSEFEPYGYKLPILSNSTVTNIYLGEVPTTRRIKKLVLTGEEDWRKSTVFIGSAFAYLRDIAPNAVPFSPIVCTHLGNKTGSYQYGNGRIDENSLSLWLFNISVTITDFKSYLATQYAAGTPVTVWYVLTEPETGIVNEPLMKIGDYADTVSMEQAGVSIPTVAGTTVIDYNGEPKPDKVELTYSKPK